MNPKIARLLPDLFVLNERAVYIGEWEHGFFSMTAVGATNVGSIKVHSDKVNKKIKIIISIYSIIYIMSMAS